MPARKVAVAGGAALHVAARLAARGANVMLTDARFPSARHIALVAARRHAGDLPPRRRPTAVCRSARGPASRRRSAPASRTSGGRSGVARLASEP